MPALACDPFGVLIAVDNQHFRMPLRPGGGRVDVDGVGEAADLVMPSKLGGMLASGRPVVASAAEGTQVASAIEGCGIVVAPDDPVAMAGAISALAADPSRRASLGAAARERAIRSLNHYATGCLLMPLAAFTAQAMQTRYDIETLAETFSVDIELVCQRLTVRSYQLPGCAADASVAPWSAPAIRRAASSICRWHAPKVSSSQSVNEAERESSSMPPAGRIAVTSRSARCLRISSEEAYWMKRSSSGGVNSVELPTTIIAAV